MYRQTLHMCSAQVSRCMGRLYGGRGHVRCVYEANGHGHGHVCLLAPTEGTVQSMPQSPAIEISHNSGGADESLTLYTGAPRFAPSDKAGGDKGPRSKCIRAAPNKSTSDKRA